MEMAAETPRALPFRLLSTETTAEALPPTATFTDDPSEVRAETAPTSADTDPMDAATDILREFVISILQ